MNHFLIRKAEQKDLPVLVAYNNALALETEHRALDMECLTKSIQAILDDERKGVYWLACDGDKVVGQLMYVFEWSTWRNANFMWLTDLYVLPAYRRKGVFKSLFCQAMDFYHSRADIIGLRFYVDKSNTAVVPLYKKVGWKESNYNLWEMKKYED